MMLAELTRGVHRGVNRIASSARRKWDEFNAELREHAAPMSGDLIKLDRKGWQFARVSMLISCEEPGKLFEVIGDDGRQYIIRPAEQSSARWQLQRLM